jgi:hypothetical protein
MTIALLVFLWAVLLFGGFLFGPPDRYRRMPLWTRIASSLVLTALGWWLYATTGFTHFAMLIALGMTLGFVGDLYMADLIPWPRPHVLSGMGSFGLGHVAYITAVWLYSNQNGLTDPLARWGSLALWLLLAGVLWFLVIYRGAPDGQHSILHMAALPYAMLLASTVGVGLGTAVQNNAFIPFFIGAALFLFSDLLIAVDLFNKKRFRQMGDVIWLTYGPAQLLIVLTILFAV